VLMRSVAGWLNWACPSRTQPKQSLGRAEDEASEQFAPLVSRRAAAELVRVLSYPKFGLADAT